MDVRLIYFKLVRRRYTGFQVMGTATTEETLDWKHSRKFMGNLTMPILDYVMIQISVDRPNVNWKMLA